MTEDRYINGNVQRRVDMLRTGDRVDLEGDIFADPRGGATDSLSMEDSDHPEFAMEFQTVREIDRESDECICVYFDNFACGFPPDHWLDVDGEQVRDCVS